MGGAPRNPAPRNLLVWIVERAGCHCTDGHLTSRVFTEDQKYRRVLTPLRSTSPFSEGGFLPAHARCGRCVSGCRGSRRVGTALFKVVVLVVMFDASQRLA